MKNKKYTQSIDSVMLEFHKITEKLMEYAMTDAAKNKFEELTPYLSYKDLSKALTETSEASIMIQKVGNPPIVSLQGMEELIIIASKGGCLNPEQLEQIAFSLTAIKRFKEYLQRCKQFEVSLAYYDENLEPLEEIREEIVNKIRGKRVDDYASKTLRSLRDHIERTESKMRDKADMLLRKNKEFMSDQFSTIRNGHICLPVKKEYKNKIAGSVLDKSATGNTLFIEPTQVLSLYEEIQWLQIEEEQEESRILYELTALLDGKTQIILRNHRTMEMLDFIFAKAKYSLSFNCCEPKIVKERMIHLVDARHPLMEIESNIPLQFKMEEDISGIIITGPNTGGKTVAIKTVALNCLMAQCGLHVTSKSATLCMHNCFLCDIGDGQSLSDNLSTFSAHMKNVLRILKSASEESFVILDELGSGTDPTEGMGLAISILAELKKKRVRFLVTTHYPEVKEYAAKESAILNARMSFDKETLQPKYEMILGEAGESCAFYIAKQLGMSGEMLKRASMAAYGGVEDVECIQNNEKEEKMRDHTEIPKIIKEKQKKSPNRLIEKYKIGDSVMIYPDKKIGIICEKMNDKGIVRVQLQDKKIYINHKRIKLQVSASELYPEGYDFSIIFDSVAKRKANHEMSRKYIEEIYQDSEV